MTVRKTAFAYRLLLLAFPADVRREFGDDMAVMFAKQIEEARQRRGSLARLWLHAIADAIVHGGGERFKPGDRWRATRGEARRWRWWVHAFKQDIKHAFRVLARQPGVTFVAILTLALGIGANSAIFSAVNAVLLRPLPYDDPDRLVTLWEKRPAEGVMDNVVSPADFADWSKMATSFESMAAMTVLPADLTGIGEPVRLFVGAVTTQFFDVLRVNPMLGRGFRPEENVAGKHRVVILGHKLWTTRFDSDRQVVGRTLSLSGIPHEVVGVLPQTFEFPDDTLDMWAPIPLGPTMSTASTRG
jgi:hypothetical protein